MSHVERTAALGGLRGRNFTRLGDQLLASTYEFMSTVGIVLDALLVVVVLVCLFVCLFCHCKITAYVGDNKLIIMLSHLSSCWFVLKFACVKFQTKLASCC